MKRAIKNLGSVLLLFCAGASAFGQAPVITSFGLNGRLVATNLWPGTTASVEWASSLLGPWTNSWAGLNTIPVDSNGVLQVSVPMFYRVRGVPVPAGMALIPGGNFTMGNALNDGCCSEELPLHTNYVSAFFMDKYEVTKALWDEVGQWAITNGYSFDYGDSGQGKAVNHPAHSMTWYDAVKWCNARSEKEARAPAYFRSAAQTTVYRTGQLDVDSSWVKWNAGYRLPTEAEWEKAARGGESGRRFPWSDTDTITHLRANYKSYWENGHVFYSYDANPEPGYHPLFNDGIGPYTCPVGSFAPNGYGVYEMAGNMYEWCWDWSGGYSSASQSDPHGPASGSQRINRGGSWYSEPIRCRLAFRGWYVPSIRGNIFGFRSVLPRGP